MGSSTRQLEDLHQRLDKSNIELKTLVEENERLEVDARKYRNQLEHSRYSKEPDRTLQV